MGAIMFCAALADRDTQITYTPGVTSDCGAEPSIRYIKIYE